jgi:WD40 repeat protein
MHDTQPVWKASVQGSVTKLAQHHQFIAIGFSDGKVEIYDGLFETSYSRTTNDGAVRCLVFSDMVEALISVGHGDRLLSWDLTCTPTLTYQEEIHAQGRILQSVCWYETHVLKAGINHTADSYCPSIDGGAGTWHDVRELPGVTQLTFSRNGQYLVGCNAEGKVYLWQYPFAEHRLVVSLDKMPQRLVLSDDGQSLLAVYVNERLRATTLVQLWNINNNQLIWERQTSCPPPDGIQLENATGISDATMQHLAEFSRSQ